MAANEQTISTQLPEPLTDSQRLVRIETLLIGMDNRGQDHETRIRRLERALWVGIGFSAAAGSAVGSFLGALGQALR